MDVSPMTASITSEAENTMGSPLESVGTAPGQKQKQLKSRNGCSMCKGKRLKCDESKPTCQQCQKRGVPCPGYKKNFKWRPFEESALVGKAPKPQRKGIGNGVTKSKKNSPPPMPSQVFPGQSFTTSDGNSPWRFPPSPHQMQFPPPPQQFTSQQQPQNSSKIDPSFSPPLYPQPRIIPLFTPRRPRPAGPPFFNPSEDIPVLVDDKPHSMMHNLPCGPIYPNAQNVPTNLAIPTAKEDDDDEIEDIIRPNTQEEWLNQYRSPSPSAVSTHSSSSQSSQGEPICDTFRRPAFGLNSPEMLVMYFDKNTCGIMSVKDGPTENPWRTLIWPLATKSPALYHAVASMTAFHMSRAQPSLREDGIEHMRKSAFLLAHGLGNDAFRNDAELATSLVLAFSEAFDRHISSGTKHLRGAKELVNQTLTRYQNSESSPGSRKMFTFLYNVWVYLDVLARLTSEDDHGVQLPIHGPLPYTNQVDPLLGCAATLFPLIGCVASLVQEVRKTKKNSPFIISKAMEIQTKLENWRPEAFYEEPEDPLTDAKHCIKTAEAYQYATLLYLHQAVPTLQSLTAHELAERVMMAIKAIPMESRSCIVHIYPLLAAGCEAIGKEERDFVDSRWENMRNRMWIGNVDKAWEVVREVWCRRDKFELERHLEQHLEQLEEQQSQALSSGSRYGPPSLEIPGLNRGVNCGSPEANDFYTWDSGAVGGNSGVSPMHRTMSYPNSGHPRLRRLAKGSSTTAFMGVYEEGEPEYEVTVLGSLHWISVMKDHNWEVLLG